MNFLAHLRLAAQVRAPLAGAVLGDLVRGRIEITGSASTFPPDLARSILLHRRIDALTDRHPLVRAAAARFAPGARRYAGILLDLVYDHALARAWPKLDATPLVEALLARFAARAGRELAEAGAWFVEAGSSVPDSVQFERLLLSYREPAGIEHAIRRVASRLRQPEALVQAAQRWSEHLEAAATDLPSLLADLELGARQFMLETPLPESRRSGG